MALGEPKIDPSEARIRLASMPGFGRWSLTAGGLGFARFAPGTWGSLPPCVVVLVLCAIVPMGSGWVIQAVLAAILCCMMITDDDGGGGLGGGHGGITFGGFGGK
jgi:hypothetical protein